MRQYVLAGLLAVMQVGVVEANGRAPLTSTINFRQGHESDIWVGLTFGALVSHDSGATWYWTCEDAVGYAGNWDPDYAYSASGKVYATTFLGPVVDSDGCTFDRAPFASTPIYKNMDKNKFATSEELGPTGELFVALDDPTDDNIYKSTDDGATFPTSSAPGMLGDTWQSLVVAKSDPTRIYASSYHYIPDPSGNPGNVLVIALFRSDNGGTSYVPLSQTGFVTSSDSRPEFVGVSQTDPDVVFLRITFQNGVVGDAIYRSVDAGANWAKVFDKNDSTGGFVMRSNGDAVAGTLRSGSFIAHDCGKTGPCTGWTALPSPPHVNCFVENAAHEVWACTQNFGSMTVPGDGYGIMKSTDLQTWTPVLKYQDIKGPIAGCPAGTSHVDKCIATQWCGVKSQLFISADPTNCPVDPLADGDQGGESTLHVKVPKGCCDTGGAPSPAVIVVGLLLLRRRRR